MVCETTIKQTNKKTMTILCMLKCYVLMFVNVCLYLLMTVQFFHIFQVCLRLQIHRITISPKIGSLHLSPLQGAVSTFLWTLLAWILCCALKGKEKRKTKMDKRGINTDHYHQGHFLCSSVERNPTDFFVNICVHILMLLSCTFYVFRITLILFILITAVH